MLAGMHAVNRIALVALMTAGILGNNGFAMEEMNYLPTAGPHDMSLGHMFSAAPLDGCDDFHCRKCKNRNHCTGRPNCGISDCGHQHGLTLLNGGALFLLRSANGATNSDGQPSCYARARTAADRLNHLMSSMGDHDRCYFTVLDENRNELVGSGQNPVIWFTMAGSRHYQKVITVTDYDLAGYQYRSASSELAGMAKPADELNKKLVAQWWASLLKDYFGMIMENQPPRLTTYTHCGKVLDTVWDLARREVPEGKIPMSAFSRAIDNLPDEKKTRLFIAAQVIPKNFDPNMR